jgi:hypothetical protein
MSICHLLCHQVLYQSPWIPSKHACTHLHDLGDVGPRGAASLLLQGLPHGCTHLIQLRHQLRGEVRCIGSPSNGILLLLLKVLLLLWLRWPLVPLLLQRVLLPELLLFLMRRTTIDDTIGYLLPAAAL